MSYNPFDDLMKQRGLSPEQDSPSQQGQTQSGNPFDALLQERGVSVPQTAQPGATPGAASPASAEPTAPTRQPSQADLASGRRAAAQSARQALGRETAGRNPFDRKMVGGKALAKGAEEHAQRQEQIAQAESEKKNYLWDYLKTTLGGMNFQPGAGVQMDPETVRKQVEQAGKLTEAAQRERELRTHTEEWEGRSELLRKVEELEDAAAWATTPEQADAIEAQLKQTREQLARGDIAAGNGQRTYGAGDLGRRFGKGSALDIGASIGSALTTAGKQMQSSIMAAQPGAPVTYEGLDARSGGALTDQWAQMDAVVDRMSENSRREFETIKNGHGAAYGAAVDVAQNMVQMGFDAAISGGHALVPMFVRTFGSSAQEARKAGATVSQQALYGVAKGTVEVLTEKIGGLGSRAYGKGWTDALTDRLVSRLANSEIGMNLVRVLMGATEEGLEEVMSDLMDPLAKQLAGMDWEGYDLDEILYDYLIGATVGGLSGSGTAVSGGYAQENAEARQDRDARDEARAWEQATGQRLSGAERRELERFIRERGQTGQGAETAERTGEEPGRQIASPVKGTEGQRSASAQSLQNGPESAQLARDESVPPSTQDSTTGETERLNQSQEAESPAQAEQKTKPTVMEETVERIKARQNPESGLQSPAQDGTMGEQGEAPAQTPRFTEEDLDALRDDFEMDPTNLARFTQGQSSYSQYSVAERLEALKALFPEEGYYVSNGNIVKERKRLNIQGRTNMTGDEVPVGSKTKPSGIEGPKPQAAIPTDARLHQPGALLKHKNGALYRVLSTENGAAILDPINAVGGKPKKFMDADLEKWFSLYRESPNQSEGNSGKNGGNDNAITSGEGPKFGKVDTVLQNAGADRGIHVGREADPAGEDGRGQTDHGGSGSDKTEDATGVSGTGGYDDTEGEVAQHIVTAAVRKKLKATIEREFGKGAIARDPKTAEEKEIAKELTNAFGRNIVTHFVDTVKGLVRAPGATNGFHSTAASGHVFVWSGISGGKRVSMSVAAHEGLHDQLELARREGDYLATRLYNDALAGASERLKSGASKLVHYFADIYYDSVQRRFNLPKRDAGPAPSGYQWHTDALQNNAAFADYIREELFCYLTTGSGGQFVAIRQEIADELRPLAISALENAGIINPGAFNGLPSNAEIAELLDKAVSEDQGRADNPPPAEWVEHLDSLKKQGLINDLDYTELYDEWEKPLQEWTEQGKPDNLGPEEEYEEEDLDEQLNALDRKADQERRAQEAKMPPAGADDTLAEMSRERDAQEKDMIAELESRGYTVTKGKPAEPNPGPGGYMGPASAEQLKKRAISEFGLGVQEHIDRAAKRLKGLGDPFAAQRANGQHLSQQEETYSALYDALVDRVQQVADGQAPIESLIDAYQRLTDENLVGDSYFKDRKVDAAAKAVMDALAIRMVSSDNTGGAMTRYKEEAKRFVSVLETTLTRKSQALQTKRALVSEISTLGKKVKGNAVQRAASWKRIQELRPDVAMRALVGFNKRKAPEMHRLAEKVDSSVKQRINVNDKARRLFDKVAGMEGAQDWEAGKAVTGITLPGMNAPLTESRALDILKILEDPDGLDHVLNGGLWIAGEKPVRLGAPEELQQIRFYDPAAWENYYAQAYEENIQDQENAAKARLRSRIVGEIPQGMIDEALRQANEKAKQMARAEATKRLEADRENAKHQLVGLRQQLKAALTKDGTIAKAMYEASLEAMKYLGTEVNKASNKVMGVDLAGKDAHHWSLEMHNTGENASGVGEAPRTIDEKRILQSRSGPAGGVVVRDFSQAMLRYIEEASDYAAFGELADDMQTLMTAFGPSGETGTPNGAASQLDQSWNTWFKDYLADLNNQRSSGSPATAFFRELRSNLAQSSLTMNAGVAMKQKPSYFMFAGEVPYQYVIKHAAGLLAPTKAITSNPIIEAVNARSGILTSRMRGQTNVDWGEVSARNKSFSGRVLKYLPSWMTNWIGNSDVNAVSNGILAIADWVEADTGLKRGTEEFYEEVARRAETAILHSQPIYQKQYRAAYLRSTNELVRSLAMFRTQPTQDRNQMAVAIGEYRAALENAREGIGTKEEVAQAKKKLQNQIAGFATAKVAFSVLTTVAQLLMHKKEEFLDEDGKISGWKIARRFGIGLLTNTASTFWFGDTAAALAVDMIAGSLGKDSSEFYSLSESTTQIISDAVDAVKTMVTAFGKDRTGWQRAKAVKAAAVKMAQALGIPLGNAYNLLNSFTMYTLDGVGANPNHDDDFLTMKAEWSKLSDETRAKKTAERAMASMASGDTEKAEALLASLNWESNSVTSAFQSSVKAAVTSGQLSQEQGDKLLHEYGATKENQIVNLLLEASHAKAYNEAKEKDKATFEAVEDQIKAEGDKVRRDGDRAKLYAVMDILLNGGKTPEQVDVMVPQNSGKKFTTDYEAMRQAGQSPEQALRFLEATDGDGSGEASQDEIYTYFLQHPEDEERVKALWAARGYADDWETYKASHAKNRAYDELALEKGKGLEEAAEALKDLKSDASYYQQTGASDREIMRRVLGLGYSDEDTDTVMSRYLSADGYKNWKAVRAIGKSPAETMDVLMRIDADRNGSVTSEEAYVYYALNRGSDTLLKAIWDAGEHKETWEGYKVSQVKGQSGKMDQVLSYGYSAAKTDEMMAQYLSKGMASSYSIARDNGLSPKEAVRVLQAIDANGNGTLSQTEMKAYYRANPGTEAIIAAIWASQDNKTSWETAKSKR